jgi:hypothetical protein
MYEEKAKKTGNTFYCFDRSAGKEFVLAQGWRDERQEGWEIFERSFSKREACPIL